MPSIKYTATASLKSTGITPTTATSPAPVESITNSLSKVDQDATDSVENAHTINAGTTATALELGSISAGVALWIQSAAVVQVTLTQDLGAGPVDNIFKGTFFMLVGAYTAVKVANPSATAIEFGYTAIGDRPTIGGGVGIF